MKSIQSIDLSPEPGKVYTNFSRPWEEEVIYFLLVDRFHDGKERRCLKGEGRIKGFGTKKQLRGVYGGSLKGVIKELDYIVDLGCTALWLSPVLENNSESYHGYAIQDFLSIDPRFGTKEDLIQLIELAHRKGLKVFLDCVINHSGNNWFYKAEKNPVYDEGQEFEFGDWNEEGVNPIELKNESYYLRKGQVENWDEYPESREGDFFSLKKFNHTESNAGLELQDILFKIYAYWLKETDCDGFRMDAAKHLGELPLARFSTRIKEYAKYVGKNDFFIFSEAPGDDDLLSSFFKSSYSSLEERCYNPTDSFLDFPLHFILSKVAAGKLSPLKLFERYESLQEHLYDSYAGSFPLITFLDNHDQIESLFKERIGALCNDKQLIAAIGLLCSLPGVPCIYYGTEQGFVGFGEDDTCVREAMFSKDINTCVHNKDAELYKEIATLLKVRKENKALVYGSLINRYPAIDRLLSPVFFSRLFLNEEIFVAYNPDQSISQWIELPEIDSSSSMSFLFGELEGNKFNKTARGEGAGGLMLAPLQFLIFKTRKVN